MEGTIRRPSSRALGVFTSLGDAIARQWRRVGYDPNALPDLATQALECRRIAQNVSYADVIKCVIAEERLPYQANLSSEFGEPPVGVYWHPKFYVEVLFWLTAT